MEILEQQQNSCKLAGFHRICQDLKEFGGAMVVGAGKGIRFGVQGDFATGNVFSEAEEFEKAGEMVALTVHELVKATFALRRWATFSKAVPLRRTVEYGLWPSLV